MAQNALSLDVTKRDICGKGVSRRIRRDGGVPGIIYGGDKDPLAISIPSQTLMAHVKSGKFLSTLLNIKLGNEVIRVIPKDVQYDSVRDDLLHVDFFRLGRGAVINVEVPVQFINEEESPGLRRGGVLNVVRYAVELECPALEIPENVLADLTGLDLGDSLHISSVRLPEGVSPTIRDRDFTIATIAKPAGLKIESEEESGEEEAEESASSE